SCDAFEERVVGRSVRLRGRRGSRRGTDPFVRLLNSLLEDVLRREAVVERDLNSLVVPVVSVVVRAPAPEVLGPDEDVVGRVVEEVRGGVLSPVVGIVRL